MRLGVTQYAACPHGRDYLRGAVAAGLEGVEPYIGSAEDAFLSGDGEVARKLKEDAARAGIQVPSVTVGYFNDDDAIITSAGTAKAIEITRRTMRFTEAVGARTMLLCTYVVSNPDTPAKRANLLAVVRELEPLARGLNIRIALENPLCATDLAKLVDAADSDRVGVYYDLGNAVYLGFDPAEEIEILGRRIFSVHVKDSVRGKLGGLHLGDGELNLASAMAALKRIHYDGWLIIETPGESDLMLARNVRTLRTYL